MLLLLMLGSRGTFSFRISFNVFLSPLPIFCRSPSDWWKMCQNIPVVFTFTLGRCQSWETPKGYGNSIDWKRSDVDDADRYIFLRLWKLFHFQWKIIEIKCFHSFFGVRILQSLINTSKLTTQQAFVLKTTRFCSSFSRWIPISPSNTHFSSTSFFIVLDKHWVHLFTEQGPCLNSVKLSWHSKFHWIWL